MSDKKINIAIYLAEVSDISGGGGAERFFSEFFSIYSVCQHRKFNLYFFTDNVSLSAIDKSNRLSTKTNTVLLKRYSNRFKNILEPLDFIMKILKFRIKLIHCVNYSSTDYPRIYSVSVLPFYRPKLVLNIVNCMIPYILQDKKSEQYISYKRRFVIEPEKIKFNGVMSWYEKFYEVIQNENVLKDAVFYAIKSRFVDDSKFYPVFPKKKIIVFASRLTNQKKPDWFVHAVKYLYDYNYETIKEWKFELYGQGELKDEIDDLINSYNLSGFLTLKHSPDLSEVFSTSACYVSTQDYENFPSLSMMEAMACGNAIIARNVGQTHYLLQENFNGYYLCEDSPEGLAKTILKFIQLPEEEKYRLQSNSVKLIKEKHNFQNFKEQMESFWNSVLQ
ncbi:MAG: glycosyltransferase [Bacteroidia bacterium]|nr:glycosyltransferase [Bacteroidia bacterium]